MRSFKLNLTETEKLALKKNGRTLKALGEYAADEICILLKTGKKRASEIAAMIAFQQIPSIGPKFAADLISIGYYSFDELAQKDGAALFDELERKQGFWTDPCVEDQCRLVVHAAQNGPVHKNWWDFTGERKAFRLLHGYPADRPKMAWYANQESRTRSQEKSQSRF